MLQEGVEPTVLLVMIINFVPYWFFPIERNLILVNLVALRKK